MAVDPEFEAWFRLAHSPGVGRDAARALLAAFGSASAVLGAGEPACRSVVPARVAAALFRPAKDSAPWLAAARRWLSASERRACWTLGDSRYPASLLETADPPLLLYVEGDGTCLSHPALAVVGSRRPTPIGAENARTFAKDLASQGWLVVSGLALGIDAAAHEGALEVGATLAVVGTGLDQVYPPQHVDLARRIADRGLLMSEFPPDTPPKAEHFPQRNRLLAGLSRGVLVVEAALRSGSLITARMATEAGREVFAIPGSIHSPQSKGCHALIKQGAKLVESSADILEELHAAGSPAPHHAMPPDERGEAVEGGTADDAVLVAMGYDPVSLDALCARLGWPVAELSARLLECELNGQVARLPGGLYQRKGRG